MDNAQQYGLTPPITLALPTEEEKKANNVLFQELKSQGQFETPAGDQKRKQVLEALAKVADAFVKKVAMEKEPNNPVLIRDARAKVFTYGSYRLGVYKSGSDIDTLIVAPRYVTREDYFKYFPILLEELSPPGAIEELTAVTDAFVPIIMVEYSGVSIDLIFSRIATLKQLPLEKEWNLKDNNLLRGLDEAELRSLNGTRVTDDILTLVPEQTTFRMALRAVKFWAQQKAIYANIMGYPGGVAWAMLVARVCQLYPKATSAQIVHKFFQIMCRWPWPQPVLLKAVEDGPLQVRVWNPKVYKGDNYHLMPVITPAYPSMCATYNITKSALRVIQEEWKQAGELTDLILQGKRPWKDLFIKHTFFTNGFKYYISVISASKSKEAHKLWSGFVESKVRVLVQNLERHPSIDLARPFNKGFERTSRCRGETEIERVQNGSLDFLIKPTEVVDPKITTEAELGEAKVEIAAAEDKPDEAEAAKLADDQDLTVYTTTHYIGLKLVEGAKSLDLSYQVKEFKDLCTAWDKYDPLLNSLSIQHLRNFDLPDDVFEAGEIKPTKPVKKKAAQNATRPQNIPATNGDMTKKRPAPEDHSNTAKRQQTVPAVAAG